MISTVIILTLWLFFLFLIFGLPKIFGWVVLSNPWRFRKGGQGGQEKEAIKGRVHEKHPQIPRIGA